MERSFKLASASAILLDLDCRYSAKKEIIRPIGRSMGKIASKDCNMLLNKVLGGFTTWRAPSTFMSKVCIRFGLRWRGRCGVYVFTCN
jgi:hypothetical protein